MKNNNPTIRKVLSKLIAEEFIASQMYMQFEAALTADDAKKLDGLFIDTAHDEYDDHMMSIVKWARANDYDYTMSWKRMLRCADPVCVKQFDSVKDNRDIKYYIEQSIDAEVAAIKSYEAALALEDLNEPEFQELRGIITSNYYDELQHLENFTFIKTNIETVEHYAMNI